jgi:hypothetical protein
MVTLLLASPLMACLVTVHRPAHTDQLLALHVDRTEAAVSAVTTAMIANQQERGLDRLLRDLKVATDQPAAG